MGNGGARHEREEGVKYEPEEGKESSLEEEQVKSKPAGKKVGEVKEGLGSREVKEEVKTEPRGEGAEKPSQEEEEEEEVKSKPHKKSSSTLKVMLFNINGKSPAAARNVLVPRIVEKMNPDILLLQETTTDKLVAALAAEGREYEQVHSSNKKESRILYDTNVFERVERESDELDKAIVRALHHAQGEEPQMQLKPKDGNPRVIGIRKLLNDRVCWVCLKRKTGGNTAKPIILVSFHNVNNRSSRRGAKVFCRAVAAMTGLDVLAGADFNCNIEKIGPEELGGVNIRPYETTERRKNRSRRGKEKIDFIVTTLDEASVKAYDFTGANGIATRLADKQVKDFDGKTRTFSIKKYNASVDHDPLVCTFNF